MKIRHSVKNTKVGRLLFALLIGLAGLSPVLSLSASLFPDEWDGDFKDAAEVFLPVGTDWLLLKSQCYQESRLDPFAVSPAGARGLCQFMDGTWSDAVRAGVVDRPQAVWIPEASIRAAGWYMGKLNRGWRSPRPPLDRYMLALASYNWGFGHVLSAQRRCDGAVLYHNVEPCIVPRETQTYVRLIIGKWWPAMLFG